MSASGSGGVLHTNSSFFSASGGGAYGKGTQQRKDYYKSSMVNDDFQAAYDYARSKEQAFYHIFFPDVNEFEPFIAKMRELFSKAEGDGERIRSLANANIAAALKDDNVSITQQLEYRIIVEADSVNIPIERLATNYVSVEGGPVYVNVNDDLIGAKKIANYVRYHPAIKKLTKTNPGKFVEKSGSSSDIKGWFHDELETALVEAGESVIKELGHSGVFIEISNKADPNMSSTSELLQIAMDFPLFQMKGSEIQKLLDDPTTKDETEATIKAIMVRLKDYIFNSCLHVSSGYKYNGLNVLEAAADRAWQQTIGNSPMFFFVGGNFEQGLKGKLGELQLDILTQYTLLATTQTNPTLGKIIGDIVDGSRGQPRSDYQLIVEIGGGDEIGTLMLGIQVKNYNESMMREIEVNTDLGLVAPNLGTGFVDSIVNAYFNTDINALLGRDMETFLKKYLETYFWKAMNLNVGDNLDPNHTNTFYWAGGTALVPASRIISTIKNNTQVTNPTFEIKGAKYSSYGDEEYASGDPPEFTKYWRDNQYLTGEPLALNRSTYANYLSSTTIHTSFKMSQILAASGGRGAFEFLF